MIFADESHVSIPQIGGMSAGDRARKKNLVDYGFRLPSAYDNRPLTFEEFEGKIHQIIFTSATPGKYEAEHSEQVVEQLIRPTGLLDPEISLRPTKGQIDDLISEIRKTVSKSNSKPGEKDVLQGKADKRDISGNVCELIIDKDNTVVYDTLAEDGVGSRCTVPTRELLSLIDEWQEKMAVLFIDKP